MTRFLSATLLVIVPYMVSAQEKKKEETGSEKVRTFAVEEVVLQMYVDYKAIENAVAAAKGNEFKMAEAKDEWTKKWNDKWTGEKLRISTDVDLVSRWRPSGGSVAIRMRGKQTFKTQTIRTERRQIPIAESFVWEMYFIFPDNGESDKAKKVDVGKRVTIEGTVKAIDGKNWTTMYLENCRLVDQPEPKKGKK